MGENLVEKYRPKTLEDVQGHNSNIKKTKRWAESWSPDSKPLLFHGPAGTGKTSTAECLANDMSWDYREINASQSRKKGDFELISQEIRSHGDTKTLFVFDEVDSVDGRNIQILSKILEASPNPVIFIANEKWKVPNSIENQCKVLKFNLRKDSIKTHIRNICQEEDIQINSRELGKLSTRNGIRDALNDLEEYIHHEEVGWDDRETDDSPFAVTRRVILNKNYIGDAKPDDLVDFLNENVKNNFDGVELLRAYQALAESDRLLGYVNRSQDYSFWAYASPIATEVSNLRLTEPYNDWVNVNYPRRRRNYRSTSRSDTPEANLYKELQEDESIILTSSFKEFVEVHLDVLKKQSKEERIEFASSIGLSSKSLKAIDLSSSDLDSWRFEEVEEDAVEDEEVEDMSIFDF